MKQDPVENFRDAFQEFQTALKHWNETQQDAVFFRENPDRNHWIRPVGEIEAFAEMFYKGHKARPGERLYYVCKRGANGNPPHKLIIRGKFKDDEDVTEDQACTVWKRAAADSF